MHTLEEIITGTYGWIKDERCFLDIETTGLCKQRDLIYCIGLIFKKNDVLKKIQWIIDDPNEEVLLLTTFEQFLRDFEVVISYNGKTFDIPFLKARMLIHQIEPAYLEHLSQLDLKKFNLFPLLLQEQKLNRQNLEYQIGFKRNLEVTGKDLVKLYNLYQTSRSPSHRLLFAGHNTEELLSTLALYEVYYLFTQIEYSQKESLYQKEDGTYFTLHLPFKPTTSCQIQLKSFRLKWCKASLELSLTILPQQLTLRKYLIPAKDYVYIPSQNQLMHKSVAQFIPATLKQKVSKEQCYIVKEGSYLPLFTKNLEGLEVWFNEQKEAFITYTPTLSEDSLWKYIKQIIPSRL